MANTEALRDLVVIGASAGGVTALRQLVSRLPADFPAGVLIALHIGSHESTLPSVLRSAGPLPASFAADGGPLQRAMIQIAPPDHHLLVRDGRLRLSRGAKEHHTRPAIDPLFRSAALWGGPRVMGVVLSGRNEDGSAGLSAVKSCGGIAIVQDPDDAEEPLMPRAALRNVAVDHRLPLVGIVETLIALAGQPAPAAARPPERLVHEARASEGEGDPMAELSLIGRPSMLVCPDCSGALFELDGDKPVRFRCHTGHAFTLATLQQAQVEATEVALWAGMRALQEKEALLRRVAELDRIAGDERHAGESEAQAEQLAEQIAALRRLVENV